VIGSTEPEIYTKKAEKLELKTWSQNSVNYNFPS